MANNDIDLTSMASYRRGGGGGGRQVIYGSMYMPHSDRYASPRMDDHGMSMACCQIVPMPASREYDESGRHGIVAPHISLRQI